MKNIYILAVLLAFLTSCNSGKTVSKEEYDVLNKAINHALQPHGVVLTTSEELNEIAQRYNIHLSSMNEKDSEIINRVVAEKRRYEFALSDTLLEVSSTQDNKYDRIIKLDSLKPALEKLPLAAINSSILKFPEGYKRISKKSDLNPNGEFLGKLKFERVIFDQSGEKAIVNYLKCKNIDDTICSSYTIRLEKSHNEWYAH